MIWEPFVLALILGLVVSGGLYFAYLWPSVEPLDDGEVALPLEPAIAVAHSAATVGSIQEAQQVTATGEKEKEEDDDDDDDLEEEGRQDQDDQDDDDREEASGTKDEAVPESKAEAAVKTDKKADAS